MDTETGCVARANPYDVTLEEHMKGKMGWYMWELMITKRWGNVHGVFYPDGTVRDPSIAAAMLPGFFGIVGMMLCWRRRIGRTG